MSSGIKPVQLLTSIAVFLFFGLQSHGQRMCGFDMRLLDSAGSSRIRFLEEMISQAQQQIRSREVMDIPIVFHVVYSSPEENISDLQIRSQIDILNRDFAYMSENAPWVPSEFKSLGGDAGIRFCLASIDPEGEPTNGITRVETTREFIGSHRQANGRYSIHYDIYGGKDGWDPDRYINVWVANMEGLLGSATFPGMAPFPEEDGVIIDPEFIGAVGLAAHSDPFDRGHTLTHELGHYFGLYHIWGLGSGGCDTDDFVEDTPEQESPYLNCPAYPQFSCGSSDMFMNFMDFTNDRCLALFTRGQNARMQGALMGWRSTLLDNATACIPVDTGNIDLNEALIYYAAGSDQILITLAYESQFPLRVTLFAIDGRMITAYDWTIGLVLWINADWLTSGVYIVRLESGEKSVSRRVVVAR